MVSAETKSVIDRAKRIYAAQLQDELEAEHMDRFVAIEPDSGEYFLGELVMAGNIMKEAMELLKGGFEKETRKKRGKVILATVQGTCTIWARIWSA